MESLVEIKSFMKDKTILISGATGFIGKVLVEKLLRDCSDLARVYILVRPKSGTNDISSRFHEYKENMIFDHVKKEKPHVMEKLLAIQGDLLQKGLGMNGDDYRLLCDSVNIVYHCAASVRFSDPLKSAVLLNSLGTKQMLDLAEQAKHLKVYWLLLFVIKHFITFLFVSNRHSFMCQRLSQMSKKRLSKKPFMSRYLTTKQSLRPFAKMTMRS